MTALGALTTMRGPAKRADLLLVLAFGAIVLATALASLLPRAVGVDDRARAIDAQLRCPTCQGLSISDSPATAATQMRQVVRERIAAGATDDEVRAFFVARYGRWILLDPPAAGLDLALWFVPALVVGIGAALVVRRARAGPVAGAKPMLEGRAPRAADRIPAVAIALGMVLALAVPIAAAVGPRLAGQEITGRPAGQSARTVAQLEAAVRAQPGDVSALVALGDGLLAAGRTSDAVERYRQAVALDPNHVGALLGIGTILLVNDRPDAAGPLFDRILAVSPDQPDALLYRAVARLRLAGKATDGVRADVNRFLAIVDPADPRRAMAAGLLEQARASAPADGSPQLPTPAP